MNGRGLGSSFMDILGSLDEASLNGIMQLFDRHFTANPGADCLIAKTCTFSQSIAGAIFGFDSAVMLFDPLDYSFREISVFTSGLFPPPEEEAAAAAAAAANNEVAP